MTIEDAPRALSVALEIGKTMLKLVLFLSYALIMVLWDLAEAHK